MKFKNFVKEKIIKLSEKYPSSIIKYYFDRLERLHYIYMKADCPKDTIME